MRMFAKVGSLSALALVMACGGGAGVTDQGATPAAPEGNTQSPNAAPNTPPSANATPSGNAHADAGAPVDRGDLNAVVASGGKLTTDVKPDAAPVETSAPVTTQVPGDNGTTLQCTYTNYSLTKVPSDFVLLSPNADVLWPGSLVQGKSMAAGVLDPIPVKRAPGTITLSLASSTAATFSKHMDDPSLSSAVQAQNDILNGFTGATPAMFAIEIDSVYSNEQLAVAVDANANGETWSAAGSLKIDTASTKSHVLIKFSQQYYTMAFDPPQGAAGVFDPSVTAADLQPYVGPGNPAVYVSSVTYGRIFYLLFESSASQMDLEAAISGSYSSGAISANASAQASWKKTINDSTIKSYAIGGSADAALGAVTAASQFDKVLEFLKTGANFDAKNPGVPVSYELRNLTDSSEVKLALTTSYTAKNCVPLVVGCDGVAGSGKVLDACGVCGGQGNTCNPCGPGSLQKSVGNGAYANFIVGNQHAHGDRVSFADGNYYKYGNALCNRIVWGNVTLVCSNGSWYFSGSESVSSDHWCTADSNASWSDGSGDSISCGWQP